MRQTQWTSRSHQEQVSRALDNVEAWAPEFEPAAARRARAQRQHRAADIEHQHVFGLRVAQQLFIDGSRLGSNCRRAAMLRLKAALPRRRERPSSSAAEGWLVMQAARLHGRVDAEQNYRVDCKGEVN